MRVTRILAATVAVAALPVASTVAASVNPRPVKGATYTGKIGRDSNPLTLKVSSNGKTVKVAELVAPFYCEGGGAGETQISKPVTISRSGTFSAVISYEFVPEHKITTKLYVKGTFNGKKVKGTARSEFLLAHQCNGSAAFIASTK